MIKSTIRLDIPVTVFIASDESVSLTLKDIEIGYEADYNSEDPEVGWNSAFYEVWVARYPKEGLLSLVKKYGGLDSSTSNSIIDVEIECNLLETVQEKLNEQRENGQSDSDA